ncbi:MAG: hypothetical protein MJY65_03215 [Bacteroidaceae bacterium]|nr:hypothetical protein [Bacteroidaceae bacterium]
MKKMAILALAAGLVACGQTENSDMSNISEVTCGRAIEALTPVCGNDTSAIERMERGVRQTAELWREEDGTEDDFLLFVQDNFKADADGRELLASKLSRAFEQYFCYNDMLTVDLQKPTVLEGDTLTDIDYIFGAFSPTAHFTDDMFGNKVAFITMLNFPYYSLEEKTAKWHDLTRLEWSYLRLGDMFTSRVPARVSQMVNQAYQNAENYIAGYNIMMDRLETEDGRVLFPKDMVLLSHWNLRDELKSNYADVPDANEKQEMIFKVMERIVCQDIPIEVVNNPDYIWRPYSNKVYRAADHSEVSLEPEEAARYQYILDIFHAYQEQDRYEPSMPDAIMRHFEGELEVSKTDMMQHFQDVMASEQVRKVGALIAKRLGRDLRPYDIWYDGFKPRASMPEDMLTEQTRKLYPSAAGFEKDMPRQLMNLGFSQEKAESIAAHIVVEGARGSGHEWPMLGRWEPARVRTRIGAQGMDYKGYNICVHEFGHAVEAVLDMYDIDHYMLSGVPNTAFTEAMAFLFQYRDLQLLGYGRHSMDADITLDIFWGMYEIMGVSMVDMRMWQWLYDNPDADAVQLREAVLQIARDVWNTYYEPVLGTHDCPILAIYSHMVNAPMYLPAYPYGHMIQYQLEEHMAGFGNPQEFALELERIYHLGRLTPNAWMQYATGHIVSAQPVLRAIDAIFEK